MQERQGRWGHYRWVVYRFHYSLVSAMVLVGLGTAVIVLLESLWQRRTAITSVAGLLSEALNDLVWLQAVAH